VSPASGARAQQNPISLITALPGEQFGRETRLKMKNQSFSPARQVDLGQRSRSMPLIVWKTWVRGC